MDSSTTATSGDADTMSSLRLSVVTETAMINYTPWQIILRIVLMLTVWGIMILPIVMLPIYISVFRSNRERDRETAVYPITHHFYHMIIMLYVFLTVLAIVTILIIITPGRSEPVSIIIGSLRSLSALLIVNVIQTHRVLLALLAFQRFILYFFPVLEPRINFGMAKTRIMIYLIHVICFLPILSMVLNSLLSTSNEVDNTPKYEIILNVLSIFFNLIFISSAFLYLPIYLSIFRLRHLLSVEKHKPQNYILYQTLLAFLLKTIQLIILISIPSFGLELNSISFMSTLTDIFLNPFLIQLPYLFCNRRNVKTMMEWLSLKCLRSRTGNINPENRVGISNIQSTTI